MSFSDVSGASNHFSQAYEGFNTTLLGAVTAGAASVALNSTTGMTNNTIVVLVVDPGNSKEQVFTGTVNTGTNTISGVVWLKGTNVDHANGATVVDYDTGAHHNLHTKGMLVAHSQDGTHKSGATYSNAILSGSPTITSFSNANHTHANAAGGGQLTASAFANNAITAPLLATSAIYLGSAQQTSNQSTASDTAVQATSLSATVTVPAGGRQVKVTAHFPAPYNDTAAKGVSISIWDGTVGSGTQIGSGTNEEASASKAAHILAMALVTPSAGSKTYNVGINRTGGAGNAQSNTSSTSPAILLVEYI